MADGLQRGMKREISILLGTLLACVALSAAPLYSDPPHLVADLRRLQDALKANSRIDVPAAWDVETAQGRYSISTGPLQSLLKSNSKRNREEAANWLSELAAHLSSFSAGFTPDQPRTTAALNRILARPEFAGDAPHSAWDRFWERVDKAIADFLQRLFRLAGRHPTTGRIVFWLLLIAAVAGMGFVLVRRWARDNQLLSLPRPSGPLLLRSSQQWILAARDASQNGDLRTAIQCAYWAGVARLQERGSLPSNLTHTPREYLKLLAMRGSDAQIPLTSLTASLERFWYARLSPGADDFAACLGQLEALGCPVH